MTEQKNKDFFIICKLKNESTDEYTFLLNGNDNKLKEDLIFPDGFQLEHNTKIYFQSNLIHRDGDLPAVEYINESIKGKAKNETCGKWFFRGKLHRNDDLPAIVNKNGDKYWYLYGNLHRIDDAPAVVIASENRREWYILGKLDRENDKPAVECDGKSMWYKNNLLHRENDQPAIVFDDGSMHWYKDGMLHRIRDQPAIVGSDGRLEWWNKGKLHREAGNPAIIYPDGEKQWWKNGSKFRNNDEPAIIKPNGDKFWYDGDRSFNKLNRFGDQPAIEYATGEKIWYIKGKIHRDNDLPAIIRVDGSKEWYVNNKLHRYANKPAIESANGDRFWYFRGKLHRDFEPALILSDGKVEHYRHGKKLIIPKVSHVDKYSPEEISKFPAYLICKLCNLPLHTASIIYTGHSFCENCIKNWFKKNKTCPIDKTEVKNKKIIPNLAVRESIMNLKNAECDS